MIQYLLSGGPVVGIFANVDPGDETALVDNEHRWCGPLVVEKVIDAIGTADSMVNVGQDGVGIAIVINQGLHS